MRMASRKSPYECRDRINIWFRGMSVEIRTALVDILKSDTGRDGRNIMKEMAGMVDVSASEVDPELEIQDHEPAGSSGPV